MDHFKWKLITAFFFHLSNIWLLESNEITVVLFHAIIFQYLNSTLNLFFWFSHYYYFILSVFNFFLPGEEVISVKILVANSLRFICPRMPCSSNFLFSNDTYVQNSSWQICLELWRTLFNSRFRFSSFEVFFL